MPDVVPPAPEGYHEPIPYPKPQRLLEVIALVGLAALAYLTDLLGHFFAIGGGSWIALSVLLVLVVSIYTHEAIHYMAHLVTGYDPTMRIWPPAVWSEGVLVPRRDNLIHLSAPLIVLNLVGVILWFGGAGYWSFVGHFVVVENTVGSFSDLFGIGYNLSQRPETRIAVLQEEVEKELVYRPVEG